MKLKFLSCLQPSVGTAPNLYSNYKLFKQKVEMAFKGQFKDCDDGAKVGAILNWLGDNAYEIYENIHWEEAAHKDDPDHVLKAFEKYFKLEQNQFHSWYMLGSIYSGQFKCQNDFLNRLREVARDCSFTSADEIICFLFLTHNQNTCVREELLKTMKTEYSLQDALQIAHLAEGTMNSEELSKQYLDTVKMDAQVDGLNQGKGNQFRSRGYGHGCGCGQRQSSSKHDTSHPKPGQPCQNCGTMHPPKRCPAFRKSCYYCKKEGHFSKFCQARAHSQSQQCGKKDVNDFENDQYTEQFTSFEFEQDSFNTIHFGRNLKGRNHSNILFDEIDELACILTDLHIQGASDPKDSRPISNQYKGPVLKCRFKVDSGAYSNLLPYNIYKELFPGMPDSVTKRCIDHSVCLVVYNKGEIKQYGHCMLKVNYRGKTIVLPFYIVNSKFKPIIGLDASTKLGLISINCPIHQSWTSHSPTNTSVNAVSPETHSETPVGKVPDTLTKEWITNHPKYKHLFKGIGRFKCDPVHITLAKDTVPVQKPPRRVPLALREQFKNEIDNMVSQGILTKLDDANKNAPEWLNSFIIVKKPNGNLRICLDPTDLNPYIV